MATPFATMLSSLWTNYAGKYSHILHSEDEELTRNDFPSGFRFGVASAAYQIEGAALEDGRGLSIWDVFSHISGNIYDGSTGDIACNHYHLYKEDIRLMKQLGVDAYRFSIAWPRLFPDGSEELNLDGVSFYNSLIDHLLENGIEPYATLYHWDLPLYLENDEKIKGWRTKEIVKHFAYYAETCFKLFGDRVKSWITFNEIRTFASEGYGSGTKAPGRCSIISNVAGERTGDSGTEPYIVAHNALLSHLAAVQTYREKFQAEQKGRIGMSVDGKWFEPYTDTKEDIAAAQRSIEFEVAWILDPIILGDYPESMRKGAGDRLPHFTEDESRQLQGSVDFIGYNFYTAYYAKNAEEKPAPSQRWYGNDRLAITEYSNPEGKLIGERIGPPELGWVYNCPWALPKMIAWIEHRYGKERIRKTPILITENGTMDMDWNLSRDQACNDLKRVEYLRDTLQQLAYALKEYGYNVQGYFAWSILDNFEWSSGLACRFGLYYVDFENQQKRYMKCSAAWYQKFLQKTTSPTKSEKSRGCFMDCQFDCWLEYLLHFIRRSSALYNPLDYHRRKHASRMFFLQSAPP